MPEPRRVKIDGREGFVAFLDGNFNPVEQQQAMMAKIIFDDGGSMWVDPRTIDVVALRPAT